MDFVHLYRGCDYYTNEDGEDVYTLPMKMCKLIPRECVYYVN